MAMAVDIGCNASLSHMARAGAARGLPPLVLDEVRRVQPARRRVRLRDILRHGAVVRVIALRDLTVKYKQSLLGPAWLVILPGGLLAGLIVGFQTVLNVNSEGAPYPLFALTGLVVWTYFQSAVGTGSGAIVSNAVLICRTSVPRLAFPTAILISTLPMLALTVATASVWSIAAGQASWRVGLLPLGILWLLVVTSGAVALVSSLAAFLRDVIGGVPFILQVGVFFAPVGYPIAGVHGLMGTLLRLNPVTGPIEVIRTALVSSHPVDLRALALSGLTGAILVVLGWQTFVHLEAKMADVV
jgi:lipopolysaccharide transport system permease protein